ncbi:hypothetical protein [Francisella sp. SYW-9]|uniref:hypothetical protein n=1 Tax=Francisella sp. SYW-9 TaxID=2610888 RepID=UPI00123D338B|nr:hypothetical protein [Francisella sp. SYW-9]
MNSEIDFCWDGLPKTCKIDTELKAFYLNIFNNPRKVSRCCPYCSEDVNDDNKCSAHAYSFLENNKVSKDDFENDLIAISSKLSKNINKKDIVKKYCTKLKEINKRVYIKIF